MTRRLYKSRYRILRGFEHEIGSIRKDGSGDGWVAFHGTVVSAENAATLYPGNQGFACPYGKVGDVLWVRETWAKWENGYIYKVDQEKYKKVKWKPSIHMPRAACRIELKITDIRAERLQDINEADAVREGVKREQSFPFNQWLNYESGIYQLPTAVESFKSLWGEINGKDSWEANPFVWAISFEPTFLSERLKF